MLHNQYFLKFVTLSCVIALMSFRWDNTYRTVKNNNFQLGEKLEYVANYAFLYGAATVNMDTKIHYVNNRPCYKVAINGKTTGMLAMMMKVNDTWESYIDTSAMIPHKATRDIIENKYTKKETVVFDHLRQIAEVRSTTGKEPEKLEQFKIPRYAQDMVSGYYYLRTLDFKNFKVGDTISVEGFFENKNYNIRIKYLGKETVSTKVGKIPSHIIAPIMPNNEMFDGKNSIKFWVSDDENRIPVKIWAKMFIGGVELGLVKHQNLKAPLNVIK